MITFSLCKTYTCRKQHEDCELHQIIKCEENTEKMGRIDDPHQVGRLLRFKKKAGKVGNLHQTWRKLSKNTISTPNVNITHTKTRVVSYKYNTEAQTASWKYRKTYFWVFWLKLAVESFIISCITVPFFIDKHSYLLKMGADISPFFLVVSIARNTFVMPGLKTKNCILCYSKDVYLISYTEGLYFISYTKDLYLIC